MSADDVGERPYRWSQRRYENSERGRASNRERQRRFQAKVKASLSETAALKEEIAALKRVVAQSELGLSLKKPKLIVDILTTMPGAKQKVFGDRGVLDLLVRHYSDNTISLASLRPKKRE